MSQVNLKRTTNKKSFKITKLISIFVKRVKPLTLKEE